MPTVLKLMDGCFYILCFGEERCSKWFRKNLYWLQIRERDKVRQGQFYARSTVCKAEIFTTFIRSNSPVQDDV